VLRRDDFLAWLSRFPDHHIVGTGAEIWDCPVARFVRERFGTDCAAVTQGVAAFYDASLGKVIVYDLDPGLQKLVSEVDRIGRDVTAAWCRERLGESFGFTESTGAQPSED
jgi:hypothetical protein